MYMHFQLSLDYQWKGFKWTPDARIRQVSGSGEHPMKRWNVISSFQLSHGYEEMEMF